MKLKEILKSANVDIDISGISYNSKETKLGDVFVAITGFNTDGHKYAKNAQENGAVCIVCEYVPQDVTIPCVVVENSRRALAEMSCNFYDNPTSKLKLIGITGTNGKTTVTYLVKAILEANGEKVGLMGTNKNMIGNTEYKTNHTTPESLELQRFFKDMADAGCTYGIMEVSSHSLELSRVYGCRYDVGAFTNLTQDHLDFHGDMESYFKAKSKLFDMCENAVINCDDPYGARLAEKYAEKAKTYGINNGDISAKDILYKGNGVYFSCGDMKINLGIPGVFSVYNALTAIGICKACKISDKVIENALNTAEGVKGRAEVAYSGDDFTVIIDYAHTPDGLENILSSVRGFAKGRVVVVFGCGGNRDKTKRPKMGRVAGKLADFCIVTSDNPRKEEPDAIIRDILEGMGEAIAEYVVIENRRDAIEYAVRHANKDDVIVLAGKGHEDYQVLKDKTIHFDEREIIRDILNG